MDIIRAPQAVDLSRFDKELQDPETFYGLPQDIHFCHKCVISNQRPNSAVEYKHTRQSKKATIHFDEQGICDACNYTQRKKKEIDWDERDRQLRELCDRHRKNPTPAMANRPKPVSCTSRRLGCPSGAAVSTT